MSDHKVNGFFPTPQDCSLTEQVLRRHEVHRRIQMFEDRVDDGETNEDTTMEE